MFDPETAKGKSLNKKELFVKALWRQHSETQSKLLDVLNFVYAQ